MDLRLVARLAGGREHDLRVQADDDITIGAMSRQISAHLGADPGGSADVSTLPDGRFLAAEARVAGSGLGHGVRLRVGPPPDRPASSDAGPPLRVLEVLSGPGAGTTFDLRSGDHTLGRDPTRADVAVDDASVSGRHLAIRLRSDTLLVRDLASTNGTLVEGAPLPPNVPHELADGELVQVGRSLVRVRPWVAPGAPREAGPDGTVAFNRPPRIATVGPPAPTPIEVPPGPSIVHRIPIATSLLPLIAGVVLAVIVQNAAMLVFGALSPIIAVLSVWLDRRSTRGDFAKRARAFRSQLRDISVATTGAREAEQAARRREHPDAPTLLGRALRYDPELWDRRLSDADFLELRVGSGSQPSRAPLDVAPGGSDELRGDALALVASFADVRDVPVLADAREAGAVGLVGPAGSIAGVGRWLALQAAILHSPHDLVIAAAIDEEHLLDWQFLKWLPHTTSETSPLRGPHLVADRRSADALVGAIGDLARQRVAAVQRMGGSGLGGGPFVLLVVDEAIGVSPAIVSSLLADAPRAQVAVLWLGSERTKLPGQCTRIVDLDGAIWRLSLTDATTGQITSDVIAEGVSHAVALDAARALAPLRDVGSAGAAADLPSTVALMAMLQGTVDSAERIGSGWHAASADLSATIGEGRGGLVRFDLRRDGPHGLIAGTTGAGKSELLQTIVISLAAAHPPRDLNFLLVDYKGGAAFRECSELPHTVGLVTDLDAHLARRVLDSLGAEIRRREHIVRDHGAKDLATLAAADPAAAPPSLLVVVDEFATLAAEVPEFVDGVVNIAQRGRSLGLHLLLATQRPAGVVTANIRANTNLRIALRVNDQRESEDVIEAPDASRIPRSIPGRAFLRTGHTELVEFQTGYVGGRSTTGRKRRRILVEEFAFAGVGTDSGISVADEGVGEPGEGIGSARVRGDQAGSGPTDLGLLVARIGDAAANLGLGRPRSPWLPPLPKLLQLAAPVAVSVQTGTAGAASGGQAEIGLIDEPARQEQRPLVVDLAADGSVIVCGTSGSGKTTLLRTLAVDMARRQSPQQLHLYGLDFASRGLAPLMALPHCGAVIAGDDDERVQRLFALLEGEIVRRKDRFLAAGVYSLDEYLAAPQRDADSGPPPARIVVLLDGYPAFAAAYERVNYGALPETLPRIVTEGRQLGIHVVVTVERRGAIPSSLAAVISNRIVLRQAEADDYAALGVSTRNGRTAELPPGRGFVGADLEAQVSFLGDSPGGAAQGAAMERLGRELRARWGATTAPAIETLGSEIELAGLPRPSRRLEATLGLGYRTLAPVTLDLELGHLLVLGPHRSGRSTSLATIVASLQSGPTPPRFELLAPRRTPLRDVPGWDAVALTIDACQAAAARLLADLDAGRDPGPGGLVVVIDDGEELEDSSAANDLALVARRGRDAGVRIVGAAEIRSAHRSFSGWMPEVRKEQQGILLDPDSDIDGDLFGARLPRRGQRGYPPGRGFLVRRGEPELIQVARSDHA